MDKIDELQAKVKELEQEKRIVELQLHVARLEAEIAALRAQPIYVPIPYPVYPEPNPWRNPWITWDNTDSTGKRPPSREYWVNECLSTSYSIEAAS